MNRRDLIKGTAAIAGAAMLPKVAVAKTLLPIANGGTGATKIIYFFEGARLSDSVASDINGIFPPIFFSGDTHF